MLESMRKGQRWLTGLFVLVIGGVFVFFMGLGQPLTGGPSQGMVVELGDFRLTVADFQRVREQQADQYRDQLGDQFNSKAGRSFLDAQALRALVDRAVLAHEAEELGLRVGTDEIKRVIAQSPGFRDDEGNFSQEGFTNWVEYQYGTQRNYAAFLRRILLGQKMVQLLYGQGDVSDGEARAAALYRLEQVQLAYVALDNALLPAGEEPSEEAIAAYSADNEAALQALYDERIDEYQEKEQLRLRHILFELGVEPTPGEREEAQERAQKALDRLEAGEEFAAVAKEVSEDAATKGAGGDLGLVEPADIATELADAAAKLGAGERSGIVESDQGLHILLVEEKNEARTRSFDEVRDELSREGATRLAAAERADRLSDELSNAIREGASLEDAARERELPIERTGLLRRRPDGFVLGLGASKELMATAFALSTDKASSPEIFTVGDRLVLIQLLDREEPETATLDAALAGERIRLVNAKRNAFLQNWLEARRSALTDSGQLLVDSSIIEGS